MEHMEQPLTQPEEVVLEMLRENVTKNELSYAFLHWKNMDDELQVSVVVAGPHEPRLFDHIDGLAYTSPEEFAIDICTNHCCVGPEFLMKAAVICCNNDPAVGGDAPFTCLKAPGMNAVSSNGRFFAICTEEAMLVEGVTPDTIEYTTARQH